MPRITELLAWVMVDCEQNGDTDNEGIPAANASGMVLPLMGADIERMHSIRRYAYAAAKLANRPVKLIRCSQVEVLEIIHPET